MKTVIENIVNDHILKIEKEKQRLIKDRIFKNFGVKIDLEIECRKMFPKLKSIIQNRKESYYWNNGTDSGFLLITFWFEEETQLTYKDDVSKFSTKLMYI